MSMRSRGLADGTIDVIGQTTPTRQRGEEVSCKTLFGHVCLEGAVTVIRTWVAGRIVIERGGIENDRSVSVLGINASLKDGALRHHDHRPDAR